MPERELKGIQQLTSLRVARTNLTTQVDSVFKNRLHRKHYLSIYDVRRVRTSSSYRV
jgi:hypothetical protein